MKVLILDDDDSVGKLIEKAVLELNKPIEVFVCTNTSMAKAVLETMPIDIAFLDIEVSQANPSDNGIKVAEALLLKWPKAKIIFVSAYPNYALKAFDVHAFDFLVKPIDLNRVKQSARSLIQFIEEEKRLRNDQELLAKGDKLFVRSNREMLFLPFDDIFLIEKVGKEVIIHTAKDSHAVRWTLSEIADVLPSRFVRVHKSFLVNATKISKISEFGDRTYEIYFDAFHKTAILSRYKVNDLFEVMNIPFKE